MKKNSFMKKKVEKDQNVFQMPYMALKSKSHKF